MAFKLLIDGELVDGASTLEVINPATGVAFAHCARADQAQLNEAVAAAKRAFPNWSGLSFAERKGFLTHLASAIEERGAEFAALLTREQGKPLAEARREISGSVAMLLYCAEQELPLQKLHENDGGKIFEQRSPLGVVAAIVPWNVPIGLLMLKMAPALIVGNTVVAKPAPTTPLTTALLGEVASGILPPGVLNIIVDDNDLGQLLSTHPDIAKVSFTGSTVTGKRIMSNAAGTLKRLTLELGGNDAAIILDDADVKTIAPKILNAAIMNAGQVCLAAKRIFAPRTLYDEVCEELARLAQRVTVGNGLDEHTQMGPLQNRRQYEHVLQLIEDAASANGKILSGGVPLQGGGYFIAPTVICNVSDDVRVVREEQFGPVIPVLVYDTVDEVVERANNSVYGLGGTIWTGDPARGLEVALRIHSGTIWVNEFMALPPDVPLGGAKQSGIGRERGPEGMKEFTQGKIIAVANAVAA